MDVDIKNAKAEENPFDGRLVFSNPQKDIEAVSERRALFVDLEKIYKEFLKNVTSISAKNDVKMSFKGVFTIVKIKKRRN